MVLSLMSILHHFLTQQQIELQSYIFTEVVVMRLALDHVNNMQALGMYVFLEIIEMMML